MCQCPDNPLVRQGPDPHQRNVERIASSIVTRALQFPFVIRGYVYDAAREWVEASRVACRRCKVYILMSFTRESTGNLCTSRREELTVCVESEQCRATWKSILYILFSIIGGDLEISLFFKVECYTRVQIKSIRCGG